MKCKKLAFIFVALFPFMLINDTYAQSDTACLSAEQSEKLRQQYLQILKMFEVDLESMPKRVARMRELREEMNQQYSKLKDCQDRAILSALGIGCSAEINVYNTLVAENAGESAAIAASQELAKNMMDLKRAEYPSCKR